MSQQEHLMILQELREVTASLGELRLAVNAMWRRIERLEGRAPWVGTIQGLEGEWTVTPPPWVLGEGFPP